MAKTKLHVIREANFNKIPLGGFKAGENATFETEFTCSYVKQGFGRQ